jgi:sulfatase maturation enzyme AslB (radical SAM superfamily)
VVTGSGDPLASSLYREFLQNLDFSKYPKLQIELFTNGLLLTPMMWDSLHKINPAIYKIRISIDAANEHTYRLNRRGGNFKILLENLEFIKKLRNSGDIEQFYIQFVVQKNNYKEMKKFVELGKKFSCDHVVFSKIRNWGTYTKKEYSEIAVHEKSHPEHRDLLEILKNPIFKDPFVWMIDLNHLLYEK